MARHKGAPYYVRSVDGRAILEFRTTEGQQKHRLGLPYDPERSSPAECRAAQQAAERKWRELTSERVVEEHSRVKTTQTFNELYALYLDRWEPGENVELNEKKRLQATLIVRRAYGATIMEWAGDESLRPDKTKRWRADSRTPLERVVADAGPSDFLAWRLTKVTRKTMRKEKSNLVQFLDWAKGNGFLASIPAVTLPQGLGIRAVKNGRGVHIPMTPVEAGKIIVAMPEYSTGRRGDAEARFLVRSFFEVMWLTGLRPATLSRLEIGRNWSPGDDEIRLDDADDKAQYGRAFPLTRMAAKVLERVAPASGHIWGHHDRREYVKAAAELVFAEDDRRRELFGSYHLRHFVGTFLANRAGTNLAAAQYVMGHTQLSTTSGYVHPDKDAARELLEATEAELRKAGREAERWAKKSVSSTIRVRSS